MDSALSRFHVQVLILVRSGQGLQTIRKRRKRFVRILLLMHVKAEVQRTSIMLGVVEPNRVLTCWRNWG